MWQNLKQASLKPSPCCDLYLAQTRSAEELVQVVVGGMQLINYANLYKEYT